MRHQMNMVYIIIGLLFTVFLYPAISQAGGLILYEVSSSQVGLASAGYAARAEDTSTLFTNPAGMTRIEGSEFSAGLQPIYLKIEFSPDSNTTTSGEDGDASGWLPTASLFYVNSESSNFSFGVGVLGYFGLGLDYGDDWVGRYYVKEVTMQGLTIMPSVAFKVNDQFSIGAGLNLMYGMFKATSAINNMLDIMPDGELKVEDTQWGYGANLGLLWEPVKDTRFGLTYLSEVELDFEDTPKFSGLGPGITWILERRGIVSKKTELNMTVPKSIMVSGFHALNDEWAIMGNLGWQEWSSFGKVGVSIKDTNITDITADRKYENTLHVAFGGQCQVSESWLLTAGIAHDSSMVKDENRTLDLPVGETWRIGLGGNYQIQENLSIGMAYALGIGGNLPVDVEKETSDLAGRVSGEFKGVQMHFLNVSLNLKF